MVHNRGAIMMNGLKGEDPIIRNPGSTIFHVALTATDAPYSKWQCRIMYYWYKRVKDLPGSEMGKFTRILHSGSPDDLIEEIPTFIVDPLPGGLDRVRILVTSYIDFAYGYF